MIITALSTAKKYLDDKSKEGFDDSLDGLTGGTVALYVMMWLLDLFLSIFALFLSFRRNQGLAFGPFLAACCCPVCYIVYHFAVPLK